MPFIKKHKKFQDQTWSRKRGILDNYPSMIYDTQSHVNVLPVKCCDAFFCVH